MLRKKMINFMFILWICLLFENVVPNTVTVQSFSNNGTMLVEGRNVNGSYIKVLSADSTISKIYVYIADTFYVDVDLMLPGIAELHIFASTWNITRPVRFDLSGLNGTSHESTIIKGSAGDSGNKGMDGGNFFALANELINGHYLTVISNGGNGGDGQDGGASDDVYVLFGGDNAVSESSWFSKVDPHNYFKKYFSDKGYDADLSGIDNYTSLYAVFVHNKKASFNIRLHPQKCCGTTGIGGSGGPGGRGGTFTFKYVGNSYVNDKPVTTPLFIANDGSAGKSGKDAKTCETFALDVRADTEMKKIVFFFPPLHETFSSQFTVLNHINCSKCAPEYVKIPQKKMLDSKPIVIETASAVLRYKRFLLENMKNQSLKTVILRTYKAIDKSREIKGEYSLEALIMEALQLEKYSELKKSIHLVPLYQRLSKRIKHCELGSRNDEEKNLKLRLEVLLWYKLSELRKKKGLITNLTEYTELAISEVDHRKRYSMESNIADVELLNKFNQLKFYIDGNFFLTIYNHVIDGFKRTCFPFAAKYLDMYEPPISLMDYEDLNGISSHVTYKLHSLRKHIVDVDWDGKGTVMYQNGVDKTNPDSAFFIWKNSDVRDKIGLLFAGKKITLLADVKQSKKGFNALKFNTVDLVFRSSDKSVNDELNDVLRSFKVNLNHTGQSANRCNNNFYEFNSESVLISTSFIKNHTEDPMSVNEMMRNNRASLSPYALWEFQLVGRGESSQDLYKLQVLSGLVDIELHGIGQYLEENESICESSDLKKFYSQF